MKYFCEYTLPLIILAVLQQIVTFLKVCDWLPFRPGVVVAREAFSGKYDDFSKFMVEIIVYAVVLYVLAIITFNKKMKSDKK